MLDSLFDGFAEGPTRAVIAWPDADEFARADPETYEVGLEILLYACDDLANPSNGLPEPVRVDLFVVADGNGERDA